MRLATGTRDSCVQVWTYDSGTCTLVSKHSNIHHGIVPKALAFGVNKDLYVFGLYDGGLYVNCLVFSFDIIKRSQA